MTTDDLQPCTLERLEDRRMLAADMLGDLNPAPAPNTISNIVKAGDVLFFTTSTTRTGAELWRTDSAESGFRLVKDIVPGPAGSNPTALTPLGEHVIFFARDAQHGLRLMRSDGTDAGTTTLREFPTGKRDGQMDLTGLVAAQDKVFFQIGDGARWTYWVTDGTTEGTHKITAPDEIKSSLRGFFGLQAGMDGQLYFTHGGVGSQELWRTDGTAAGLQRVARLGLFQYAPHPLYVVGDTIYFLTNNADDSRELWASDGSESGTRRLAHVDKQSPYGIYVDDAVPVGEEFAFALDHVGNTELWWSDGTPAGTRNVRDFGTQQIEGMAAAADTAYFVVGANELWRTDGTEAGTALVTRLDDALTIDARRMKAIDDLLLFQAYSTGDCNLWATDGTEAGTAIIADACEGGYWGQSAGRVIDGKLYFGADSGHGIGLWSTDGTSAGTQLIATPIPATLGSNPRMFVELNGVGYFIANEAELWRTDGTDAGTTRVAPVGAAKTVILSLKVVGDRLVITRYARRGHHRRPLDPIISDGTPEGTMTFIEDEQSILPGRRGYFLQDVSGRLALFATDTPPEATQPSPARRVRQIAGSAGEMHAQLPGGAFFTVQYEGEKKSRLWFTDGTADGTRPLRTIGWVSEAVTVGNRAFFSAFTDKGGVELWVTDGTRAGTVRVRNIAPGKASADPEQLTVVGDTLFFVANDGRHGPELWRSDGTRRGTHMVRQVVPDTVGLGPEDLTAHDGLLYFKAHDGLHGSEPWRSDGTEKGTRMVADIQPGPGSSNPLDFLSTPGRLLFSAHDGQNGTELWEITSDEARMVHEFFPGPGGSSPTPLGIFADKLLIRAADADHRAELWAVD